MDAPIHNANFGLFFILMVVSRQEDAERVNIRDAGATLALFAGITGLALAMVAGLAYRQAQPEGVGTASVGLSTSYLLGLAAFVMCFLVGLPLGYVALRRDTGRKKRAIAAVVIGWLAVIGLLIALASYYFSLDRISEF
ncbi:MAG: hypothetical protein WD276_02180 [Actinomycetota bacterium]